MYFGLIDAKIRASDKDLPVQWKAHDALILCLDWSATNGKIVSGKVKKLLVPMKNTHFHLLFS